jgi:hypothetical protein
VPGVFPGGKGGWWVRLTTLPLSCAVVMKSGNLNFLEPSGPLQTCNGTALPLYTVAIKHFHEAFTLMGDHCDVTDIAVQQSTRLLMVKSALLWIVTQEVVIIPYRRFGRTYTSLFYFYCCTAHFDYTEILITNQCTSLLHI